MRPLDCVLERLAKHGCDPQKTRKGFEARCPVPSHDDSRPSLSVDEGDDRRVLVHCFGGCDVDTILAALGLKMADLFPHEDHPINGRPPRARQVVYPIKDKDGRLVAEHIRDEYADGSKQYWWRRDGKPGLGGFKVADLPLFGTLELSQATSSEIVFVTEGEKARDALLRQHLVAVATVTGAESTPSREVLSVLADHDVVLWPDNDAPGRSHMTRLGARLRGTARRIRILDWPEAQPKADAHDFFARGGTKESLLDLIEAAKEPAEVVDAHPPGEDSRAEDQFEDVNHRPEIIVTKEMGPMIDLAEEILLKDRPRPLFQRGRILVRVVREGPRDSAEGQRAGWLTRPRGAPLIVPMLPAYLRERLSLHARWFRPTKGGKAREILPPDWIANGIFARAEWPFPQLEGIVEAPTLRPDGSILSSKGYDPATGLLYLPRTTFPQVPLSPTAEDIREAIATLRSPFEEFPFIARDFSHPEVVTPDEAAALQAELTLVGRGAIDGATPMSGVDAPERGTGKTLLVRAIVLAATGREPPIMVAPNGDEEMRKRAVAIGIEAPPAVLIDNVEYPLGFPSLSAALTGEELSDRLLGVSRMVKVRLRAVWFCTGNNLAFRGDTPRRVIPIGLDANVERPEEQEFEREDLLGFIRGQWPQIYVAALTILRGYHVAGRPSHGQPRLGSYEQWDDWIRGAVVWAVGVDPCETRNRVREEQDVDLDAMQALVVAWEAAFPDAQPVTLSELARTARERADGGDVDLLDALSTLDPRGDPKKPSPTKFGYAVRRWRNRHVSGLRIERLPGRTHGKALWRIVRLHPATEDPDPFAPLESTDGGGGGASPEPMDDDDDGPLAARTRIEGAMGGLGAMVSARGDEIPEACRGECKLRPAEMIAPIAPSHPAAPPVANAQGLSDMGHPKVPPGRGPR